MKLTRRGQWVLGTFVSAVLLALLLVAFTVGQEKQCHWFQKNGSLGQVQKYCGEEVVQNDR